MTDTAAIYVNTAGYARYYEHKGQTLGPVTETGLTRVPLHESVETVWPDDIVQAETAYRAQLQEKDPE